MPRAVTLASACGHRFVEQRAAANRHPTASVASELHEQRIALAAARANGGDAERAAAALQFTHERADDARTGGPDRVTEGDRAAVDVDLLLVDAELVDRMDRHVRKRLVELVAVDVTGREPLALEQLARRAAGHLR